METNYDESVGRTRGGGSLIGRTLRVFAVSLVGIAGLGISLYFGDTLPPIPEVSPTVAVALSLVTPAILLLVASAVGAFCAPRVGLRSHIAGVSVERATETNGVTGGVTAEARHAIPWGLFAGVLLVGLDATFAAVTDLSLATGGSTVGAVIASLPMRFLYGGIAEEVMLRWGFMALLALVIAGVAGQGRTPSRGVMWTSIVVSAVVFGLAHLPAVAQTAGLTPLIVARTILLNSVGGILFGWLFWRDSLEAAMVGHASAHVILASSAFVVAL
ncbi:CPBP family intramembrane glutamic endopeptidase [Halorussus lipolyticus]|uniref:CPBP family intramembrane glutamic endopeptidase n=1 Tax=Halorussus lipolyticus TaxID=3034024 RepID=UPI0023E8A597|nr:CPBP family intramembrane glutamic endopeptidase [Halorussus sp. DT80]